MPATFTADRSPLPPAHRRIARSLSRLANQDTARANAADALAVLRTRRKDHDDVKAYLQASTVSRPIVGDE